MKLSFALLSSLALPALVLPGTAQSSSFHAAPRSLAPRSTDAYELVIIEPWNTSYSLAVSRAAGINNLGQVSGSATPVSGSSSYLWTRETGKVQVDMGGKINDQGVIAGAFGVRWPDGTVEPYDLLSIGEDINELNVVAGTWGSLSCFDSLNTSDDEAGIWEQRSGTTLLQHTYGIVAAEHARAINDSNELVGVRTFTGECGGFQAFWFDLSTEQYVDLHALLGGSGKTEAFDINDLGVVLGAAPETGAVRPFLWHPSTGFTFLPDAPNADPNDTHLESLNDSNEAVGWALVDDGSGGLGDAHGFVWDADRGYRDLNDLTTVPDDFTIDRGIEINDEGWIIASGHYGTWSPERAVVLVPTR